MTSRHRSRIFGLAAVALPLLLGVSSCSSDSAPAQTPTPTDSPAPSSSVSTSASPTSGVTFTPPAYGAAAPAVSVYLKLDAASIAAFADPQNSTSVAMDRYLIGDAKTTFDAALADERKSGKYYKGTPATQRVRVVSTAFTTSPKRVELRSCPLEAATNPSREYYAATGKAVPTAKPKVPPPYAKLITVLQLSGKWMVSEFSTDATKTCTP